MTAVVPTVVEEFAGTNLSVNYPVTGATVERQIRFVYIEVTSTATSNTIALGTYMNNVSGVIGVVVNTVDGATSATAPTWSTTTLTLAQHAGSGGCQMILAVY